MEYTVRPISDRTAFTGKHIESQFTVTWTQAERLLLTELAHLRATSVVVELDMPETSIRVDCRPRADRSAASPAVRLAFESGTQGALVYATDRFTRGWSGRGGIRKMVHDWQHNVYAIAKSLEALRLVDRYGVTGRGEQYTGFKAIGAGRAMPASHMTSEQARNVLYTHSNYSSWAETSLAKHHRSARAATHPDLHAGDQTAWDQVEQAAQVLGLLH